MPQTAEEFIDRLEFLGLLEEKVLANLRRQVADSKKPVAPQILAKLLVDQGQLTPFQAKKLVGDDRKEAEKRANHPSFYADTFFVPDVARWDYLRDELHHNLGDGLNKALTSHSVADQVRLDGAAFG